MMFTWDGIEDPTSDARRVWLARILNVVPTNNNKDNANNSGATASSTTVSNTLPWKPLRKIDCTNLNDASEQQKEMAYIENGRATAYINDAKIVYNFHRGPVRELCSALWFLREEKLATTSAKSKANAILHPVINRADSDAIEELYQQIIKETSSSEAGLELAKNKQVTLSDESIVKVVQVGNELSLRKHPPGWFSTIQVLQRGYGDYTIVGEAEEVALGPVQHLILVVHGIGEALFSKEDVKLPSLVEQMNTMRAALYTRQVQDWKQACQQAEKSNSPLPEPPGRIELVPIEWFHALHDDSTELMKSLRLVTLPSIPALRNIANDVIFDVLMYLTPQFCQSVLENVTEQIQSIVNKFQKIHSNFDGNYSLIGHSLGSVIVWDMLSILREHNEKKQATNNINVNNKRGEDGDNDDGVCYSEPNEIPPQGHWGPNLLHSLDRTIPFVPRNTIFVGSPLGMFLTLRGAHGVFEKMRQQQGSECTVSPFVLPTGRLYNIFHPSDPIAYRIEPLLLSPNTKEIPAPIFLTAPGQDLRLHLKAKQISSDIQKSLRDTTASWKSVFESAVAVLDKTNSAETATKTTGGEEHLDETELKFPLGGLNNRVDVSLQPNIIESEYISAVLAHSTSTYFGNGDLLQILLGFVK